MTADRVPDDALRQIASPALNARVVANADSLLLAHGHSMASELLALRAAANAGRDNLRDAWAAMAMIREAIETLGPVGALPASEHLAGPTFTHEAEAIVAGIRRLAGRVSEL